jgi:hypothetical protein
LVLEFRALMNMVMFRTVKFPVGALLQAAGN